MRIVGAVCARTRLDGVVSGFVSRDGSNSTPRIIELIRQSQFARCVRAVLLQGIAVAGFNVIDVTTLHEMLEVPVLVIMRRPPRLHRMKTALLAHTRNAATKWDLIERAGDIERRGALYLQRVRAEPGPSRPSPVAQRCRRRKTRNCEYVARGRAQGS